MSHTTPSADGLRGQWVMMKPFGKKAVRNTKSNYTHQASREQGAGMTQWLSICLPPMWPGFDSRTWHHMWVEFVVGSCPCSQRFLSGYSGFPLSSKTNISKFQFDLESEGHKFISLGLLRATLVKQRLFIYLFI